MLRRRSTRGQVVGFTAGGGTAALALIGCGGAGSPPAATREGLVGTFEMVGTDASVQLLTMEKAMAVFMEQHPQSKVTYVPTPAFVAGKQPKYYVASVPGYSLSALLKPEDVKAKIGAALFRHLYTAASAITFANEYSGAIAIKGLYGDQKFRETRYGAGRATLDRDVIAKTVMLSPAADPGFGADLNKVIAGQLSVKPALSEMQQKYNAAEEEAQRNRR